MTILTNNLNEQLFQELDNKVAQKYNGGIEVVTIANQTKYNVSYHLDGRHYTQKPKQIYKLIAYKTGIIVFDRDVREGVESYIKYDLADGQMYAFRDNKSTSNPYDIDLYKTNLRYPLPLN